MTGRTMKAWRLRAFGLDNLNLEQAHRPVPGPTDVLVRVGAVSLNYRDRLVVNGELLPSQPEMPFVPVSDFCGDIVETGGRVRRFAVGDRIVGNFWTEWIDGPPPHSMRNHGASLGGPLPGALSQFIAIPETAAVMAPSNLTDGEAATLPIAALTAWFALVETGALRAGQTVLVQGTGGVALAGLQVAAALGARVIVTSRSAVKLAQTAKLGAWAGIDTAATADWPKKVMELTDGAGVDHILELIGGENLARSFEAAAPQAQISLIGFLNGMDTHIRAIPFLLRRIRLQGVSVGHRRALERLVRFIQEHDIHPVIDQEYGFDQALHAFAHLDRGPFGKVVIRIND